MVSGWPLGSTAGPAIPARFHPTELFERPVKMKYCNTRRRMPASLKLAASLTGMALAVPLAAQWWDPGEGRPLPAYVEYGNEFGRIGLLNTDGEINTAGHPFF